MKMAPFYFLLLKRHIYAVNIEDEAKLLAYITNDTNNVTTTKVYDSPGILTTCGSSILNENRLFFPNPVKNFIVILFNPNGVMDGGTVVVFDFLGNCLRKYTVDSNFDNLTSDSSTFPG
jgi:hypothetical protein